MKNIEMFCISLEPSHKKFIQELGYIPVGLGTNNFEKDQIKNIYTNSLLFLSPQNLLL